MDSKYFFQKEVENIFQNRPPKPEGHYTYSSVMVLFTWKNGEPHILFTRRALTLKHQPGDICFPGGRREKSETSLSCALRETYEEIGLSEASIRLLGQSDVIITPSKAIITPYLGFVPCDALQNINYNPDEVEEIFFVPFSYFMRTPPEKHCVVFRPHIPLDFPFEKIVGGRDYKWSSTPLPELFYDYHDHHIWGMTARIIHNIVEIVKESAEEKDMEQ